MQRQAELKFIQDDVNPSRSRSVRTCVRTEAPNNGKKVLQPITNFTRVSSSGNESNTSNRRSSTVAHPNLQNSPST